MSAFVPAVAQNAFVNARAGTGALEYLFGECVAADFDAGASNRYLEEDIQCRFTPITPNECSVWPRFVEDWGVSEAELDSCFSPESFSVLASKSKCGFKRPKTEPKSSFTEGTFTTTPPTTECCIMRGGSYVSSNQ